MRIWLVEMWRKRRKNTEWLSAIAESRVNSAWCKWYSTKRQYINWQRSNTQLHHLEIFNAIIALTMIHNQTEYRIHFERTIVNWKLKKKKKTFVNRILFGWNGWHKGQQRIRGIRSIVLIQKQTRWAVSKCTTDERKKRRKKMTVLNNLVALILDKQSSGSHRKTKKNEAFNEREERTWGWALMN